MTNLKVGDWVHVKRADKTIGHSKWLIRKMEGFIAYIIHESEKNVKSQPMDISMLVKVN